MTTLRTRYMPNAGPPHAWLRWQTGRDEKRDETEPADEELRVKSSRAKYPARPALVDVFHLLGWGETREKSEAMAKASVKPGN